eukprot:Ihof_evm1s901 gene=Ihof_evmTU1s901
MAALGLYSDLQSETPDEPSSPPKVASPDVNDVVRCAVCVVCGGYMPEGVPPRKVDKPPQRPRDPSHKCLHRTCPKQKLEMYEDMFLVQISSIACPSCREKIRAEIIPVTPPPPKKPRGLSSISDNESTLLTGDGGCDCQCCARLRDLQLRLEDICGARTTGRPPSEAYPSSETGTVGSGLPIPIDNCMLSRSVLPVNPTNPTNPAKPRQTPRAMASIRCNCGAIHPQQEQLLRDPNFNPATFDFSLLPPCEVCLARAGDSPSQIIRTTDPPALSMDPQENQQDPRYDQLLSIQSEQAGPLLRAAASSLAEAASPSEMMHNSMDGSSTGGPLLQRQPMNLHDMPPIDCDDVIPREDPIGDSANLRSAVNQSPADIADYERMAGLCKIPPQQTYQVPQADMNRDVPPMREQEYLPPNQNRCQCRDCLAEAECEDDDEDYDEDYSDEESEEEGCCYDQNGMPCHDHSYYPPSTPQRPNHDFATARNKLRQKWYDEKQRKEQEMIQADNERKNGGLNMKFEPKVDDLLLYIEGQQGKPRQGLGETEGKSGKAAKRALKKQGKPKKNNDSLVGDGSTATTSHSQSNTKEGGVASKSTNSNKSDRKNNQSETAIATSSLPKTADKKDQDTVIGGGGGGGKTIATGKGGKGKGGTPPPTASSSTTNSNGNSSSSSSSSSSKNMTVEDSMMELSQKFTTSFEDIFLPRDSLDDVDERDREVEEFK